MSLTVLNTDSITQKLSFGSLLAMVVPTVRYYDLSPCPIVVLV